MIYRRSWSVRCVQSFVFGPYRPILGCVSSLLGRGRAGPPIWGRAVLAFALLIAVLFFCCCDSGVETWKLFLRFSIRCLINGGCWLNPCSTAVYRNLYRSLFSSDLSPNWDCSPKRVKAETRANGAVHTKLAKSADGASETAIAYHDKR